MQQNLDEAIKIIATIEQLWAIIQKTFKPENNKIPCPLCRKPKAHHTKCETQGCRLFKEWLKTKYVGVYASLAWEVGSHEKYHKKKISGTLSDILKMLPEDKLKEMKEIIASAANK
jgi:hypothetical protein